MSVDRLTKAKVIDEDPQQQRFSAAVSDWVNGKISEKRMREDYPYRLSDGWPWFAQVIRNVLRNINLNE